MARPTRFERVTAWFVVSHSNPNFLFFNDNNRTPVASLSWQCRTNPPANLLQGTCANILATLWIKLLISWAISIWAYPSSALWKL